LFLRQLPSLADDIGAQADYIVLEMVRQLLGGNWLDGRVAKANLGATEYALR
jgi:hypothetical protein